ncbi:response regulator transcription factor [Clostridium sp. MSJ-11]|uniref:Response regulator transcription factor n=1 Tax=Clostridium mobile TaxID=2841512 RepID=A0ABS6EEP5_9CLOT|nr:response regulator transcription factor [Clostridium mobile]MBU5483247.1 response regulator transcription factor [Clostridium mobile]
MRKIFIIEDDKKIREELSTFLSKNGYVCEATEEFESIIEDALSKKPNLILLDINLPAFDGYYICREIRKKSEIPIIVVTSRDTEIDELMAMNLGADDFITKPYNTQILLAHISSVLKRASREIVKDYIQCGDFLINLSKSTVEHNGVEYELTKNELKILTLLYENRGTIVSRDDLMIQLWNSDMFIDDNTLTVNVNRLRKKLQEVGIDNVIETKRGRGYMVK